LLKITEARSLAMGARTIDDKIVAEQQLTSALQGLKVSVEAYPDLKANQNFLQLQEELSDIENKLAAARRFFNAATTEYNNSVESFPGNLIANNFGFKREIFFDLGEDNRKQMEQPPTIKF
jgi:LemA protein